MLYSRTHMVTVGVKGLAGAVMVWSDGLMSVRASFVGLE